MECKSNTRACYVEATVLLSLARKMNQDCNIHKASSPQELGRWRQRNDSRLKWEAAERLKRCSISCVRKVYHLQALCRSEAVVIKRCHKRFCSKSMSSTLGGLGYENVHFCPAACQFDISVDRISCAKLPITRQGTENGILKPRKLMPPLHPQLFTDKAGSQDLSIIMQNCKGMVWEEKKALDRWQILYCSGKSESFDAICHLKSLSSLLFVSNVGSKFLRPPQEWTSCLLLQPFR